MQESLSKLMSLTKANAQLQQDINVLDAGWDAQVLAVQTQVKHAENVIQTLKEERSDIQQHVKAQKHVKSGGTAKYSLGATKKK